MTAALLSRHLTIGMRTAAFGAVLAAHAGLLAGFLVLWEGGVPMLPGANIYAQMRLVQAILLTTLLPWTAARCASDDRGNELTMLSLITACGSSRLVLAQFAGLFILLAAVVFSGLPLLLVAGQMAAVPPLRVVVDILAALGLAAISAAVTLAWLHANADRFVAWLGATASTAAIVLAVNVSLPQLAAAGCLVVLSLGCVAASATRAGASTLYLSEDQA